MTQRIELPGGEYLHQSGVAAARAGVSYRTLQRYVRSGKVRPTVILPSGRFRWSDEDIERLRSNAIPADLDEKKSA